MEQDRTFQQRSLMEENYTLICNLSKKIFSQYEGKVVQDEKGISIISNNLLGEKRIECKVTIGLLNCEKYPFCVDGEEKTYSIIGGCGCPCENEQEVEERAVQTLDRYKFIKKEQEQLSLFDFEW